MMPFSVFGSSNATDRVTLHKQNPFFDKALQKDTFTIKGIQYTRCEVIAVKKKVRAPTSPIWKSGEALLCAKHSKRYFYCWHCEVTSAVQQLLCVNNGNSSSLDCLWKKHQLDRTTGESLTGVSPSVKTSFAEGVVYQQLTKQWTLSEFKDLLVRWMVYCHIAFRMVENEYFCDLIKFLSSSLGGILPRAISTIRSWIMEAYLTEKVTVEREL
jgi:hypothetical protein